MELLYVECIVLNDTVINELIRTLSLNFPERTEENHEVHK
jgi:hypothetical protein